MMVKMSVVPGYGCTTPIIQALGARGSGSTGSKMWKSYFEKYLLTS